MDNTLNKIDDAFSDIDFKSLRYFVYILFILILYCSFSKYNVVIGATNLLDNDIVRFIIFSLAAFAYTKKMTTGVLLGLIMTIIFMIFHKLTDYYKTSEGFEINNITPDVHPGCFKITAKDLLNHFDGEQDKLIDAMSKCGVPYNLTINDFNAPLIATYLISNNFMLSDTCKMYKQ